MPNPLLDAALAYARRGWPIFPCRADKTPMISREDGGQGVLDATTDPAIIRAWWERYPRANIGLDVGGAGLMILDLDEYKPGFDRAAVEAALGGLPQTSLRQRSPRGGEHLFYALDKNEIAAPSVGKIAPGCDVRSFHSYVLLSPSRTIDGAYTWEGEGKPAFRTDEMLRIANTAREKHRDRDNWIIEPDLPENVADAVAWLKKDAKIAVEGQGGDAMAYATAAHLKSFGVSEALALDLMWEHWNPRCRPPWTADEIDHLETKVRNGYSYNTSPPGNITAAFRVAKTRAVFQPVAADIPSGREFHAGRFRFVDRTGMDHIRAPEWLVHDFITQGGYALLIGARGTFKTFVALDVALSVATGCNFPWDGLWPEVNGAGPVLFAAGEGRPGIRQRIQAWERYHRQGRPAEGLILADPVPRVGEDLEPFIEGALKLSPNGYPLTVIDTVGRSMQGVNENAQEHASKFTMLVERLQHELGGAVLALHHTGHEQGGRARGSSVFEADPDTIIRLDREEGADVISLTMTKQKEAEQWKEPRMARLVKVQLAPKVNSLVAVAAKNEKPPAAKSKPDQRKNDAAVMLVLDKAVIDILAANPVRAWTTRQIAEVMAARGDVEIPSKQLANGELVRLRETAGTVANRCYDPIGRVWRFRS